MPASTAISRRTSSSPGLRRSAYRRAFCAARQPTPPIADTPDSSDPPTRPDVPLLPHMPFRSTRALILLGMTLAMLPFVPARAGDTGGTAQASEVRGWLLRIHEAAGHRNFQGTFVVSSGGGVSSARIAHYCEGKNQFERSESLDGQPRYVFRHNDVVHTLWPGSRVAMVEQ